jgi:hypothetical protein
VKDDLRAERQWPEPQRRGKRVVHHEHNTARARKGAERGDVRDAQERIRDDFDQQQARVGTNRALDRPDIGGLHEIRHEAQSRQLLADQPQRAAVQLVAGHEVIARLEQSQHDRRHRRHAGRGNEPAFRALERGDLGCQELRIRTAFAPVGESLLLTLVDAVHVVRVAGHEHGAGNDRRHQRRRCRSRKRRAPHHALMLRILRHKPSSAPPRHSAEAFCQQTAIFS